MRNLRPSWPDLEEIISGGRSDLAALRSARLFITGGTGYIGRWLLEALAHANKLLELNLSITVLSRNPERFLKSAPHFRNIPYLRFVEGDVRTFDYPPGEFSHAIHAATDVVLENSPLDVFDVTVLGTRRVIEFCNLRGVGNVLLLSSGAAYGPIPHNLDLVPEDYPGSPRTDLTSSAYGIGKLVTEWLGTAYSQFGGNACKSARVFAQLGPYLPLDKQFAAGNFILNALKGEEFLIKGDGTPRRSYMYATDLIVWLLAILVRGAACRMYNVGSDDAISIRDLAAAIARVTGASNRRIVIQTPPRIGIVPERYVPDVTRARVELDLKLHVSLDEAIQRTFSWYQQHFGIDATK